MAGTSSTCTSFEYIQYARIPKAMAIWNHHRTWCAVDTWAALKPENSGANRLPMGDHAAHGSFVPTMRSPSTTKPVTPMTSSHASTTMSAGFVSSDGFLPAARRTMQATIAMQNANPAISVPSASTYR